MGVSLKCILVVYRFAQNLTILAPCRGNNEFYISKIKSIVDHVRLSLSFFQGKLKQYQEDTWLSFVNAQLSSGKTYDVTEKRYHRYKSIAAIEKAINEGKPISFIKFKDRNELFVAVERSRGLDSSQKFVQLQRKRSQQTIHDIVGLIYSKWELVQNSEFELHQDILQEKLLHASCGILISFGNNISSNYGHTAITEDWKVINTQGTFSFPSISKGVFDLNATNNIL